MSQPQAAEDRTIGDLTRLICTHYTFDQFTYPELAGSANPSHEKFALNHCTLHLAKTVGQIAAVLEAAEHGKDFSEADLRTAIPKALITVLRLAALVNMSEADIVKAIEDRYSGAPRSKVAHTTIIAN